MLQLSAGAASLAMHQPSDCESPSAWDSLSAFDRLGARNPSLAPPTGVLPTALEHILAHQRQEILAMIARMPSPPHMPALASNDDRHARSSAALPPPAEPCASQRGTLPPLSAIAAAAAAASSGDRAWQPPRSLAPLLLPAGRIAGTLFA
jgi:hypothetical protein